MIKSMAGTRRTHQLEHRDPGGVAFWVHSVGPDPKGGRPVPRGKCQCLAMENI